MRVNLPGEMPGPMGPFAAGEILDKKDGYEMTEADQQMGRPARASSSANSCSTAKASFAGASPRSRKAGGTCSAAEHPGTDVGCLQSRKLGSTAYAVFATAVSLSQVPILAPSRSGETGFGR